MHRVAWGGTVKLTGRLEGGYLPPGGALVRLRIGLGRSFITYGVHEHVGGGGRFTFVARLAFRAGRFHGAQLGLDGGHPGCDRVEVGGGDTSPGVQGRHVGVQSAGH